MPHPSPTAGPCPVLRFTAAALIPLALLAACLPSLAPSTDIPVVAGNRRVLFVGNSLTYYNDLPAMVQALARSAGDTALRTAVIAEPDFALEDHYYVGTVQKTLDRSDWEFVVLQQGTSALPESQQHLRSWTSQLAPLIRAAGAEPVLYQVWPMISRRFDADAAVTSYFNAAVAVQGIFAPAGDAFTDALALDPEIGVYSSDGLHPTPRGTYVAALVILSRLIGTSPESLPPRIPGASADTATVRLLQRAAAMALARHPATPTVYR
jgi:hypothetical protein